MIAGVPAEHLGLGGLAALSENLQRKAHRILGRLGATVDAEDMINIGRGQCGQTFGQCLGWGIAELGVHAEADGLSLIAHDISDLGNAMPDIFRHRLGRAVDVVAAFGVPQPDPFASLNGRWRIIKLMS